MDVSIKVTASMGNLFYLHDHSIYNLSGYL